MSDAKQMMKLVQWQNSPDGIAALKIFRALDARLEKIFCEAIASHWHEYSAAANYAASEAVAPEQILAYFMAAFAAGMRETVIQRLTDCCEDHIRQAIAAAVSLGGNLAIDRMRFAAREMALAAAVSEKGTRH